MRRIPIGAVAVVTTLSLLAAACSASQAEEVSATTTTAAPPTTTQSNASPTTTSSTLPPPTTTTSTTSTTIPQIGVGDTINGIPADDDLTDRRVIAVKIDNHPRARPQSGIESADAVYEIVVEAGLTRFMALFHQSDSDYVGPIRSVRPVDVELTTPLDAPMQMSGGSVWVLRHVRNLGMKLLTADRSTAERSSDRRAPHNLYGDTEAMRAKTDRIGWEDDPPPPLFLFGSSPTPLEEEATFIELPFSDNLNSLSQWQWDGERYLHSYNGVPHTWRLEGEPPAVPEPATGPPVLRPAYTMPPVDTSDDTDRRVAADTLVVIKGELYTAKPPKPSDGVTMPATHTVGSGDALVFHHGGMLSATWARETMDELIRIFDTSGNEVVLPPGRVWISIFPDHRTLTWE